MRETWKCVYTIETNLDRTRFRVVSTYKDSGNVYYTDAYSMEDALDTISLRVKIDEENDPNIKWIPATF